MSNYGGNLRLAHVQQVFPNKSRGKQADIHAEFGESTNNPEELKAAYIKKYGSLREEYKISRERLQTLIREEISRLVEDRHGGGHTTGDGPTFTGAGPGAHPPQGFYDPNDPDSDQHGTSAEELGFEHGSSGVTELDGLGLAKAGYRDADDLIAYQNGYDQGQIEKGKSQ